MRIPLKRTDTCRRKTLEIDICPVGAHSSDATYVPALLLHVSALRPWRYVLSGDAARNHRGVLKICAQIDETADPVICDAGRLIVAEPRAPAPRYASRGRDLPSCVSFGSTGSFAVLLGDKHLGDVDPKSLEDDNKAPRIISLGGRPWKVAKIDWRRQRACLVTQRGRKHLAELSDEMQWTLTAGGTGGQR